MKVLGLEIQRVRRGPDKGFYITWQSETADRHEMPFEGRVCPLVRSSTRCSHLNATFNEPFWRGWTYHQIEIVTSELSAPCSERDFDGISAVVAALTATLAPYLRPVSTDTGDASGFIGR